MTDEGKIRDSKLTDRFDWNSRDGVTYSADDWQVVVGKLEDLLVQATKERSHFYTGSVIEETLAALACLREREARERSANHRLVLDVQEMEQRAEAAEARVARLEEALLEIADEENDTSEARRIARRALAHEEEK